MKAMNGLVMTLEEGKRFLCVWLHYYVSNYADSRMKVPRYRSCPTSWDHFFFLSVFSSSEVLAKINQFGRLQLAGLGKKREETVKPTCFMSKATSVPHTLFWGSVDVSQNPFKTQQATPTSVIQFISNYMYYQYFLQALTPAPTFTLKLLVGK